MSAAGWQSGSPGSHGRAGEGRHRLIAIEEARLHYQDNDASHDFEHVLRVLRIAERIGAAEGADMTILRTAVLLHDVAREEERLGGICHAAAGAKRARAVLAGHPEELVGAVEEAIATHRFRAEAVPRTLEAQVLYDADKLDAIGAIGIARAYAIAGAMGQRLWGEVPEGYAERGRTEGRADELDRDHTPAHEFAFKLSRLRDTLFTRTARRIGEERHAYMVEFFGRLAQEVGGRL